jgi:hypothetical protein
MRELYKGFFIDVELDECLEDPREFYDHLGTMLCFHRRYNLGDDHDGILSQFESDYNLELEDIKEIESSENVIALPLYLYDHSDITMNTTGFSCKWDSGKLGFIYIEKSKAKKEFGFDELTPSRIEFIKNVLVNEVKEYDSYIRNEMYWYSIKQDKDNGLDNQVDTCHMFLTEEDALNSAKEVINSLVKDSSLSC